MTIPHPQVRRELLWWLECTLCGIDVSDGRVPRFASEQEMWAEMLDPLGHGWSRRDDGRILCRRHSEVADCDVWGHQLTLWSEHPLEPDLDWRYCGHCGAAFEQRCMRRPD